MPSLPGSDPRRNSREAVKPPGLHDVSSRKSTNTMKSIKFLSAFFLLAALARADSAESTDRVIQLPPVVVEATRLPNPVIELRSDLDEAKAASTREIQADMRHTLTRSFRRLVAEQRRVPPAAATVARKPNV